MIRTHEEEVDYVARMVLALVRAVVDDPSRRAGPAGKQRPERERIGPNAVNAELERLLGEGRSA